jgi:hypothetical protein
MTDLRTRALAALSGACWPDNEAREETIGRMESALRDARAAGIREAAGVAENRRHEWRAKVDKKADQFPHLRGMHDAAHIIESAILALIEKDAPA